MLSPAKEILANLRVVLASSSPQRKAILQQLGVKFDVIPSPFYEETVDKNAFSDARDYVKSLAHQKALAVAEQFQNTNEEILVVGADTVIIHDDKIIGKPHKHETAVETLNMLNNGCHQVCTGVSLIKVYSKKHEETLFTETTRVTFGKLTQEQIRSYVDTGEPLNKAGAYGIQGLGALLVEKIDGDYYNVVGFPAYKFFTELVKFTNNN
ncbi:dTTP/UTP pyrophosphatase-like [Clavelina lepadiformis]|uniref:Maf-like protein n=1 Tax=Clavelina lepadiformis TaxID=159417 RepID=A0ABP0H116_CLALP